MMCQAILVSRFQDQKISIHDLMRKSRQFALKYEYPYRNQDLLGVCQSIPPRDALSVVF